DTGSGPVVPDADRPDHQDDDQRDGKDRIDHDLLHGVHGAFWGKSGGVEERKSGSSGPGSSSLPILRSSALLHYGSGRCRLPVWICELSGPMQMSCCSFMNFVCPSAKVTLLPVPCRDQMLSAW